MKTNATLLYWKYSPLHLYPSCLTLNFNPLVYCSVECFVRANLQASGEELTGVVDLGVSKFSVKIRRPPASHTQV